MRPGPRGSIPHGAGSPAGEGGRTALRRHRVSRRHARPGQLGGGQRGAIPGASAPRGGPDAGAAGRRGRQTSDVRRLLQRSRGRRREHLQHRVLPRPDGKEIGRYHKVCPTVHERVRTPGRSLSRLRDQRPRRRRHADLLRHGLPGNGTLPRPGRGGRDLSPDAGRGGDRRRRHQPRGVPHPGGRELRLPRGGAARHRQHDRFAPGQDPRRGPGRRQPCRSPTSTRSADAKAGTP